MKRQALLPLLLILLLPLAAAGDSGSPYIEVIGEGRVLVSPDRAVFQFGLEAAGQTLDEAKDEIARESKALLAALKREKVASKDIQTARMVLSPRYEYRNGKRKFVEYTGSKSFTVTLTDLESYGNILNEVLKAGASQISGPRFETSKLDSAERNARKKAAQNAKEKAEELAGYLGQKVGKAILIEEPGDPGMGPRPQFETKALMASSGGETDVLAEGEIPVSAKIRVRFELK